MSPTISQETIDKVLEVRENCIEDFYCLIVVLRDNGWTLQDIANSFTVSKSAVANWEKRGLDKKKSNVLSYYSLSEIETKPVVARLTSTGTKRAQVDFPTDTQDEVSRLTAEARVVSKNTPLNASSRKSAVLLEELLSTLNDGGISMARLAKAAGVSRRAVAQRINKAREAA